MVTLTHTGCSLQHASADLQADRAVALAAVKTSGYALQHASAELCADRDFVLAAVASNGYALRQTSPETNAEPFFLVWHEKTERAALSSPAGAIDDAQLPLQSERQRRGGNGRDAVISSGFQDVVGFLDCSDML